MIKPEEKKEKIKQLYEKYRKPLFYIAIKILDDKYLAEDTVQDTFIKIIENLNKMDNIDSCETKNYIMTIAKNHSFNLYCKRKHHAILLDEMEGPVADYMDSKMEELDSFQDTIKRIPTIYSKILTLKYIQEYTNPEIADILHISEVNVRKRLERAKSKVKESFVKTDSIKW